MTRYIVNRELNSSGIMEIHNERCQRIPSPENRIYFDGFVDPESALQAAKIHFPKVEWCAICMLGDEGEMGEE